MGKTPEETKKGLECCTPRWVANHWKSCSSKCPYIELAASCRGQLVYDALAYIEQLEAQVTKWISVYTQMPKDGQHVLAANGDGVIEVLYYDKEWPNAFCGCGGLLKVYNVTHWMPLPEPPKE